MILMIARMMVFKLLSYSVAATLLLLFYRSIYALKPLRWHLFVILHTQHINCSSNRNMIIIIFLELFRNCHCHPLPPNTRDITLSPGHQSTKCCTRRCYRADRYTPVTVSSGLWSVIVLCPLYVGHYDTDFNGFFYPSGPVSQDLYVVLSVRILFVIIFWSNAF